MKTYVCCTPEAMRQNMTTFLSPYNPQDPPEILFKQCADCEEFAIIAKVKYTNQELLMNVVNLLTQCVLYQCNLEDWERKPEADKTWIDLCPFIQEAYQHCLQSGTMTAPAKADMPHKTIFLDYRQPTSITSLATTQPRQLQTPSAPTLQISPHKHQQGLKPTQCKSMRLFNS